jgi:hypothetical protein
MAPVDTQEVARRLSERGEHCAIATVVWRRGPSSGKAGYQLVQFKAAGGLRGEAAAGFEASHEEYRAGTRR